MISSSVTPISSCSQSFPTSGSFPMSLLFASDGQSIGASASSINLSNNYSGLTSFRIDQFNLLVVQRTFKSLLQHHNSKASVIQHLVFIMVQFSYLYMITEKTVALTIWTFVSKRCLCFLMCCLSLS